jgi:hypothetical protein
MTHVTVEICKKKKSDLVLTQNSIIRKASFSDNIFVVA